MNKNLIQRLNDGPVLCAEGYLFAMERRGYLQAGAFVPEVVLEHPEVVSQLHREFIRAGSDVVQAFTYYGHREKLRIIGKENLENLKKIGVDCIEFSPNPEIYLKLARFGLKELGDFQWPEHLGIFTIPVQMAVKFNIPLIIWGENPQLEYGQPTDVNKDTILDREWNEKNGGYFLDKIKPIDMIKYGFELDELRPYIYPTDDEIRKVGVTGVFLGSYVNWDIFNQLEIVKKIGFKENSGNKEGTYDGWENLDVYFTVFHDYFKFLKYGFGRATDHASIEIRLGRITREKGLELVKQYEGKIPRKYLGEFLKFADISMGEFLKICSKFTNKEIFKVDENQNVIQDKDGEVTKLKYDNT